MSNVATIKRGSSAVGSLVDILASSEVNQPHEAGLRDVAQVYDAALKEIGRIQKSRELTGLGKQEATKRALTKARSALESHEKGVERLAATVAATRTKALERPASESTAAILALEREIRDRLMEKKLDPLMVFPQYLNAIERGDDTFVRAVENAPQAFALITPEQRQKGEEARLAKSPMADKLAAEENEHALFRQVVATTKTELGQLANRHRVRLAS